MEDICHLIHGLECASVCCTKRGRNKVAHVLAQRARNSLDDYLYWMDQK